MVALTTQDRPGTRALRVPIRSRDRLLCNSFAMADQPRSLDRSRLGDGPLTTLSQEELAELERALLGILGIGRLRRQPLPRGQIHAGDGGAAPLEVGHILALVRALPDPRWRLAFQLMAAYGLRPEELRQEHEAKGEKLVPYSCRHGYAHRAHVICGLQPLVRG